MRGSSKGQAPLILLAIEDITERKKAEDAVRRSNAELSDFAHVVAHDLQTPIRTVTLYAQLLVNKYKGRLDEAADEMIRRSACVLSSALAKRKPLFQNRINGHDATRAKGCLFGNQMRVSGPKCVYDDSSPESGRYDSSGTLDTICLCRRDAIEDPAHLTDVALEHLFESRIPAD